MSELLAIAVIDASPDASSSHGAPLVSLGDGRYACRAGCGACCIALSISSPIPGMPDGKPAGVRCIQLSGDNRCLVFGRADRPVVCGRLRPESDMCGVSSAEAIANITELERATAPAHFVLRPL